MKIFFAGALGGFYFLTVPLTARAADASSLAAAENAFAQESVVHGMRMAFLHALSDDGIVFQPGPQNGKKAWTAAKESTAELAWHPVLVVVAASGELGYTTGPLDLQKEGRKRARRFRAIRFCLAAGRGEVEIALRSWGGKSQAGRVRWTFASGRSARA